MLNWRSIFELTFFSGHGYVVTHVNNIIKKGGGGSEIIVIVGGIKDQSTLFKRFIQILNANVGYIFAYIWLIFYGKM